MTEGQPLSSTSFPRKRESIRRAPDAPAIGFMKPSEPCASIRGMTDVLDLKARIKKTIVERLKLDVEPSQIGDTTPLFGEGLGLDSIDALELVLGIEQEFGVKVEDEEVGARALASVDALADFVLSKQQVAAS